LATRTSPSRAGGLLAALGLLAAAAATEGQPTAYVLDLGRSHVRFHAESRFMDADGHFGRIAGELALDGDRVETATGRVTVEVASLDTASGMRDRHLRSEDFFDAERYPRAVFVVTGARRDGPRVVVSGDLTIRGVARAVAVPVAVTRGSGTVRVVGELTVNRREFGVAYQSRLNPVRDEVRVMLDLTFRAR
jgi:polyisoprenoid-binding protein YceI